jgi:(R)-2-hydroxyacyl-CoA dehydratese activating ATPase
MIACSGFSIVSCGFAAKAPKGTWRNLGNTPDRCEMNFKASDLNTKIYAGLDVGSLSTKAVLLNANGIVSQCTIGTGANPRIAGEKALGNTLAAIGCDRNQMAYLVGTGYGRVNLPYANRTVTELTCHAKGAHFLNPEVRTVIDIGGQDSKVLHVDEEGRMVDFVMNDKCAAGTGRFLEMMAKVLELDLKEIAACARQSHNPCSISNTCAVFAESEVISLLALGHAKNDIAAGLHLGVAQRVGNMAKRLGLNREVAFVGGVAKNSSARKALEDFLEIRFVPEILDPQLNGALGAAVLAREFAALESEKQAAVAGKRGEQWN